MIEKLINKISETIIITEKEVELIEQYFEPVSYSKGTLIEREGKIPKYIYYVVAGFVRVYHNDEHNDQVTTHINCPPGFITSYNHFINATVSNENVECITNCDLLRISKDNLEQLRSKSDHLKDYFVHALNIAFTYNEKRTTDFIKLTAEERYQNLIKNHPDIAMHVPNNLIASFIGIKPESLSRLRKKIN